MKLSNHFAQNLIAVAAVAVFLVGAASAQSGAFRLIHTFGGGVTGWGPLGTLAVANNGDEYGLTLGGGTYDRGLVFKLAAPRTRDGKWKTTVLYNFTGNHEGGGSPDSLVPREDGNLYGVDYSQTIFELRRPKYHNGVWTYTILHTLNPNQGAGIQGNLVFDAEGNLYGAAETGGDMSCGIQGCGTVFELKRPSRKGGKWHLKVLYAFTGLVGGGEEPFAGVVFDKKGDLYGTTNYGGTFGYGTAYRLSHPTRKGHPWTESVLYSFDRTGDIGSGPSGPVIFDASGNLYGTTSSGGGYGCGVVYELSPPENKDSAWSYATLYAFQGGSDGVQPGGYMVFDNKGRLYGTTQEGGGTSYAGIAYRLTPEKDGSWSEAVLHRFLAPVDTGDFAGLVPGRWGYFYGMTYAGGPTCPSDFVYGCGTVFELRP